MAVAVVAGLASTAGAYGTAVALSATFSLAWAGTAFAIGAGLSMISQALQPSLRVGQDTGLSTSVANPIAERPIIYGRTRTGGTIVYFTTSGADNKYLHLVIAVAGHAIDGYEKVYFDDEVIWEDGSYVDDWVQNAQINFYDGTQTTADQDLINASNEWNSNCILNDTAYIHVRLEYDPEVYTNGIPSITTTIRGKKVYDPRTDVTAWSENPALCIYDYLKDPKYGLNDDTVNEAQVIASANVCDQLVTIDTGVDQTRYALSGFISTGDTIKANLEKMLSSMFGKLVCSGGELFVNAGYYTSPVLDIDESLLVGAVSLQTKTSRRNVYNAVKGTFLSEEENYIFADYPSIKSDTYSTEDGEPLYLDLPLPCTTNNVRAQRLAKLSLNKSRQQRSLSIPVNLAGLKVRAGDVIRFTSERLGISNAEYEVIDFEFEYSDQLIVNLVCVETGSSLYDWTVADKLDFSVGSDITLYDGTAIAPTGLTATAVSNILSDGTDSTYIDVAWTNPSDIYFDYVVLKYGDQSIVTKDQTYRINNVDVNTEYTITISAYNTFGRQSTGLSTNVTTVRDTTAPADITGGSVTGGLNQLTLSWTNPSDDDFDLVKIKVGDDNNVNNAIELASTRSDTFIHDINTYETTKYYWVAPVDRTGNVGNYVSIGSATTGRPSYDDLNDKPEIPVIPEVATTAYLTLADNDAPTDTEFSTAVGRDPIENDFAIVNKEFAFKYNGTTWDVVTEFIDGSLLVSESITALGEVTAGTFSLGNGAFAVNSSGQLNATGAIISGTLNAGTINAENISFTGSLIADGLSALPNVQAGNMTQSLRNEIENIIVNKFGSDASTGSFDEVTGTFDTNSDNSEICKITDFAHNGSDIDIDVTFSRLWETSASGTPSVVVNIQRSATGANSWTTIKTQTITGSSYYEPEVKKYLASISGNVTHTDNPATGNYDYRFFAGQILNLATTTITVQLEANEQGEQIGTIDLANYSALAQDETITGNWTFSGTTSGIDYGDLDNTPTIPDISGKADLSGDTFTGKVIYQGRTTDSGGSSAYVGTGTRLNEYLTNVATEYVSGNDEPVTIYFKSGVNAPSDFAYITYDPDYNDGGENGALVIGSENDGAGSSDYVRIQSRLVIDSNMHSSDSTYIAEFHSAGVQKGYINTSGNLQLDGTITASGYNNSNWDTAYTYSQVGHLPLSGGEITGNIGTTTGKYFGYSADYNYKPYIQGGIGTRSELISNANFLIHADMDGSGVTEFVSIRAGAGTANELKLLSKTSSAGVNNNSLSLNGNTIWNAGNFATGSDTRSFGTLQINGTSVIDSSRNLTNIGTISLAGTSNRPMFIGQAGSITTKGSSGGWSQGLLYYGSSNTYKGGFGALGTADTLDYFWIGSEYNDGSNFRFYPNGTLNIGGTTVIDSSRNLTNIGTINASGTITTSGQISVGSGATASYIMMNDSDQGGRYIHCNSNRVGFLTSASGWGSWCNDDGSWESGSYISGSELKVSGTTVIDSSRNLSNISNINISSSTANITFANSGTTKRGVTGTMGDNDQWFIGGGASSSNVGYLEISTGDDGQTLGSAEEIRVVQYGAGTPFTGTAQRTLKLLDVNGNTIIPRSLEVTNNITTSMDIYGKSVNGAYSNLYRFGGIYFTWDSDSYGTNTHHSIRSTYGDTYGDHITINSFGNVRINIDSNNNGTNVFEIGHATTGTGNTLLRLEETGFMRLGNDGYPDAGLQVYMNDKYTGGVWDTYCYMGRTNVLENETTSPVFEGSGNVGFKVQANSDGAFFGIEEYSAGNYRAVIEWGDDAGEDLHFRHVGNTRAYLTTGGNLVVTGNVTAYSDITLKDNIELIPNALEKVCSVRGVTYNRTDENDVRQTGVIAQEIEKILPEAVQSDKEGIKSVAYGNMVGLLIEAIKELKQEVEELKNGNHTN